MSDQNAQEPTMEEILASIRRIISEDDAPAETPAVAESDDEPEDAPEPEPAPPAPVAAAEEEDDVLELTDPIAAPQVETHGDLEIYSSDPEPAPAAPIPAAFDAAPKPQAPAAPSATAERSDSRLISDSAARASASSFNSLAQAIAMPHPGLTLEDVTRELLKPLLAQWLDENLPRIVEAKVEEEVQRIARGR